MEYMYSVLKYWTIFGKLMLMQSRKRSLKVSGYPEMNVSQSVFGIFWIWLEKIDL
jgi:hypothetical protein